MHQKDVDRLAENFRNLQFAFIHSELELAITFCEVALRTHVPQGVERNHDNAKRALESAEHSLRKAHLTQTENATVLEKVNRVRELFGELRKQRCG